MEERAGSLVKIGIGIFSMAQKMNSALPEQWIEEFKANHHPLHIGFVSQMRPPSSFSVRTLSLRL
jgi:hypothetical protein